MPYSKKAKYTHHRQKPPSHFMETPKTKKGKKTSMKTVPLTHTEYSGDKFDKLGAKAIVGILKPKYRKKGKSGKSKKWAIQSILLPK